MKVNLLEERLRHLEIELQGARLFATVLLSFLVKERLIDLERFTGWRAALTPAVEAPEQDEALLETHSILEIEYEAEEWLWRLGAHPEEEDKQDPRFWVRPKES